MKKFDGRLTALLCIALLFVSVQAFASDRTAKKGDVDGNGKVTAADARLALRGAVGLETYAAGSREMLCADVDGNGTLTADDARFILRAAVGLTDLETLQDLTAPAAEPSTAPAAQPARLSANGYEIKEIDGVTYVGGVLIVNKTYSLPADYGPGGLTDETYSAFLAMQQDARALGLRLWIASGYRSYDYQKDLYQRYVRRDGRELADRFSARPGHSEHQTGLALDLNTVTRSFAGTAEGQWVAENCYRYGFILRYPQTKEAETGFIYEPWHLRYLGTAPAADVHFSGLSLEEYLGITSAYNE